MQSLEVFYSSLLAVVVIVVLGYFLGKLKVLNENANRVFTNLLLSVAMPCALFRAFPQEFNSGAWQSFLQGLGGGAVILLLMILISRLLFRKTRLNKHFFEHQFAFIFNNASFLGYPLVLTIFGAEAMIPYSGFMVVFNLALFSYGVILFEKRFSWKHLGQVVLNPNVIAVTLGAVLFISSVSLPDFLNKSIGYVADLTTPMSLLCIGFMLTKADLGKIWQKKRLFITCIAQLILAPLLALLVASLLRMPTLILQMFVLLQALPTATSLGLFAEKYGGDKVEASELVMVSTILSVITLPVVMSLLFKAF